MSNFQKLVREIVAQGNGEISENEALALANQVVIDRYDASEEAIKRLAAESVKSELEVRQALGL